MTEYKVVVTVKRKADAVHTEIAFMEHTQLEVDVLIVLEFLRSILDILDSAEGTNELIMPFKESIKSTIGKIVDADIDEVNFVKKMTFREFCHLNQRMHKNQTGGQLVRLLDVSRLLKKNSRKYPLPTLT